MAGSLQNLGFVGLEPTNFGGVVGLEPTKSKICWCVAYKVVELLAWSLQKVGVVGW